MSMLVQIADAVVAELNAVTFSQPLEAKRAYLPQFDLPEMKDLHVTVVPKGVTILPGSRSQNQHEVAIDVAVQKKLEEANNTEIDALMGLVDEIAGRFRLKRLDSYPDAVWLKTEQQPIYSQEHLDQMRQFTSVLTFTFRVIR
jgi:hypothetical protein